jgi:processive 1,2-diacylglycerol beta-glucosyltransferase
MKKKKIIIAMIEVGNGHKAPAIAIKKSIEKLFPSKYEVEVVDLIKDLGSGVLFSVYQHFWIDFALKYPNIYSIIYKITDNKISIKLMNLMSFNLYFKTKKFIYNSKPDLIIADHTACIGVFSMLKSKINVPVYVINTDAFDAHHLWVALNLDRYIAFSKLAKAGLSKRGIKNKNIKLFDLGYPIDSKHTLQQPSKVILRKKLEINNKRTILMFSGAEGIGNMKDFIVTIIEKNINLQILVVCGRNEKLKKELEDITVPSESKCILKVFGFRDDMQELISVSDIVFGKSGASQTFEALVKKKPLIYSTYMINEYHTLRFVVDNGMGWYTPTKKEFIDLLQKIESNPNMLIKASRNIKNIHSCSDDIAKYIDLELK